eukprot:8983623-Lingulodinium_polyedra.AAC.1
MGQKGAASGQLQGRSPDAACSLQSSFSGLLQDLHEPLCRHGWIQGGREGDPPGDHLWDKRCRRNHGSLGAAAGPCPTLLDTRQSK